MPLDKPRMIDLMGLTYETKISVVEHHCIGCGYLMVDYIDNVWPQYRCTYPPDLKGLYPYIHPHKLDVVDIVTNTCLFWGNSSLVLDPPYRPDSEPGTSKDWEEVPIPNEHYTV